MPFQVCCNWADEGYKTNGPLVVKVLDPIMVDEGKRQMAEDINSH